MAKPSIGEWHWEITRCCNLRCLHCILGDQGVSRELSETQAEEAVARMIDYGARALKITGGEPTVRPDLPKLVEMADRARVRVELITNGYDMSPELYSSFRDKLCVLAVSIDGLPNVHDRIRGSGSFSRAMATIEAFASSRTIVSASITVNALNFHSIGELVDMLLESGVTHFHINDVNIEGRAAIYKKMLCLENTPAEIETRLLEVLRRRIRLEEEEIIMDESCNIGSGMAYVAADGKVFSCVEIASRKPSDSLGHILDDSFQDSASRYYSQCQRPALCRYKSVTGSGVNLMINQLRVCSLASGGVQ